MYNQIQNNKLKSYLLVAIFSILVVVVAYTFAYVIGMMQYAFTFAVILSVASAFFSYYKSDSIALKLSGAVPANEIEYKHLHNVVEGIAIASGMPKPKVYIIKDRALNAFATGRNPHHAAIAATTGLLERLNRTELEGVISHEMSHIKNYDILFSTLVVTMVGIIAILTDVMLRNFMWGRGDRDRRGGVLIIIGFLFAILAPIVANLIQLAVSRRREYLADATGALLTRHPDGLADALVKIADDEHILKTANHATAHLFISNPFGSMHSKLENMFSTHPPIKDRIKILRDM